MLHCGEKEGKILVFGGVYSNLQALEALKAVAEKGGFAPAQIICTGDVVGYCAQAEACVQLVRDWDIHCIAGNVELNLAENTDDCGCNFNEGSRCDVLSRQWYPYAQAQLSNASLDWMRDLPQYLQFDFYHKKVVVLHGSYSNTSEFIFESTPWEIKLQNFQSTQADIILAGHSGLPFTTIKNGKYWLNSGALGMPANDGTARVWYMILSHNEQGVQAQIKALNYDYKKANQAMLEQPLPASYAQTLLTGIWDNCEILPLAETKAQGAALRF